MKKWADMTERERDVLVWQNKHPENALLWNEVDIPRYSTDRSSAMTLLDEFDWYNLRKRNTSHYCKLPTFEGNKMFDDCERGVYFVSGKGENESTAICVAFLRAKGVEIE